MNFKIEKLKIEKIKIILCNCFIIFFGFSCNLSIQNEQDSLTTNLSKVIDQFSNYGLDKIVVEDNKLDIFIADSLDINNPPYTNEFVFHFFYLIKDVLIEFDSVSLDIKMTQRENKFKEVRRFESVEELLKIINHREKVPSYNLALDWILKNDNRLIMEIANGGFIKIMGIKDIWSVEKNIFGFIYYFYNDCNNEIADNLATQLRLKYSPNSKERNASVYKVLSKIFSYCPWLE